MVASAFMCDPNHTPNARVLYSILAAYSRGPERQAIHCVPNRHRLAAMLGASRDDFEAALAELEQAGRVTVTWKADRRGRIISAYQLHDIAEIFGVGDDRDETAGGAL
jgi:DNA-binding GntR family transcriptional regulator